MEVPEIAQPPCFELFPLSVYTPLILKLSVEPSVNEDILFEDI